MLSKTFFFSWKGWAQIKFEGGKRDKTRKLKKKGLGGERGSGGIKDEG